MNNNPINTNKPINQSTNYNKFNIHDRIFIFVVNSLKIIKYIPRNIENNIIIDQFFRSLTSVGANDQEADGVSTKKDFIHCYTIVRKEAKETLYWFKLILELNNPIKKQITPLLQENQEIICIVSSIIKNSISRSKK